MVSALDASGHAITRLRPTRRLALVRSSKPREFEDHVNETLAAIEERGGFVLSVETGAVPVPGFGVEYRACIHFDPQAYGPGERLPGLAPEHDAELAPRDDPD